MKDFIWSYMIELGSNMWAEEGEDYGIPSFHSNDEPYHATMYTDRNTWNTVVNFLPSQGVNTLLVDVGEGIQYERHPDLAVPGAWSKEEVRTEVRRLKAMGITAIPKLNFSSTHCAWLGRYHSMLCTTEYYQVCKDAIEEVWEAFDHPALFHIGMDEEVPDYQHTKQVVRLRNEKMWWHDFYYLVDCVERLNCRAWIWSDYYWNHPQIFKQRMPKSVLQSNWEYGRIGSKKPDGKFIKPVVQTYADLNEMGYDQIPTASNWGWCDGMSETVLMTIEENFDREHLKGFMLAPWFMTEPDSLYVLLDGAKKLGAARRKYEDRL